MFDGITFDTQSMGGTGLFKGDADPGFCGGSADRLWRDA
jgi:hypothetical protein